MVIWLINLRWQCYNFKTIPLEYPPPLFLVGNPQTINQSNYFGQVALDISEEEAKQCGNEVILNEPTYGVSCELEYNKSLTLATLMEITTKYLSQN